MTPQEKLAAQLREVLALVTSATPGFESGVTKRAAVNFLRDHANELATLLSEHGGGGEAEPFGWVCEGDFITDKAEADEAREAGAEVTTLYTTPPTPSAPVEVAVVGPGGYPNWLASWLESPAYRTLPQGTKLYAEPPSAPVVDDANQHVLVLREIRARFTRSGSPARIAALDAAIAALSGVSAPVGVEGEEMSPEFTDSARAALAWVLYHHQGGSSPVGQPIRFALGMGAHEPLTDSRIAEAKRWAAWAGATTADFHAALTPPAASPRGNDMRAMADMLNPERQADTLRAAADRLPAASEDGLPELPELPEPFDKFRFGGDELDGFTAEQMRAYGEQCRRLAASGQGVESEPGAVRALVAAANAVLALYPGDDQLWTLESAVRPFNATKPAECVGGCPPQQVCDYCQIAAPTQEKGNG